MSCLRTRLFAVSRSVFVNASAPNQSRNRPFWVQRNRHRKPARLLAGSIARLESKQVVSPRQDSWGHVLENNYATVNIPAPGNIIQCREDSRDKTMTMRTQMPRYLRHPSHPLLSPSPIPKSLKPANPETHSGRHTARHHHENINTLPHRFPLAARRSSTHPSAPVKWTPLPTPTASTASSVRALVPAPPAGRRDFARGFRAALCEGRRRWGGEVCRPDALSPVLGVEVCWVEGDGRWGPGGQGGRGGWRGGEWGVGGEWEGSGSGRVGWGCVVC